MKSALYSILFITVSLVFVVTAHADAKQGVSNPAMVIVRHAAQAVKPDITFRLSNKVLHKIDPRMFGQFMERPSWGEIGPEGALVPGTGDLQPKVRKLLDEMDIPILRFPGGTDVDYIDWTDMIDSAPHRSKERPVTTGHRGHKVSNNFGYDEFLQFAHSTGSEAILVVNFRDALMSIKPLEEAAMHAAALVAYCNAPLNAKLPKGMYDWPALRAANGHRAPYGVKYFQIGNETWFFVNKLKQTVGDRTADLYVKCLQAYVEAMLAVDGDIEIIVDGHDGRMAGAVPLIRQRLGDKVDYFATHFYMPWAITNVKKGGRDVPIENLSAQDIWYAWVTIPQMDGMGRSVLRSQGIDAARRNGYRAALTEWNWNGWWRIPGAQPPLNSSFAKGIGAAGFIHAFMRSGDVIDIGCQSMLVGNRWGIYAVAADAGARTDPYYMPTGQVTMLYSKHHGKNLLQLESTSIPTFNQPFQMSGIHPQPKVACIDALATAGPDAIYFHAINRHFSRTFNVAVDLSAFADLSATAIHHILSGRLNDKPKPGQPTQIANIHHNPLTLDGPTLNIPLPPRTASSIQITRK